MLHLKTEYTVLQQVATLGERYTAGRAVELARQGMRSFDACFVSGLIVLALVACSPSEREMADEPAADDAAAVADGFEFTTQGGMVVTVHKRGTGTEASAGSPVTVHYTGWLLDDEAPARKGRKFDSSRDRVQPFRFVLGRRQVIPGWDEGVAGMRVGGSRTLVIPPEMAYGAKGFPPLIPPSSTLVFDVELLGVE